MVCIAEGLHTIVNADVNADVRNYTTQDGRNGASLTLRVLNVQLLGTKNADGSTESSIPQSSPSTSSQSALANVPTYSVPPVSAITESADDLPF